jgi:hypothetical protein
VHRLGKFHVLRQGIVILIALGCGACASSQARNVPGQHAYIPYDKPSDVDVEPVRPVGSSRYQQPRMADYYQYDQTELDLATPLPSSPPSGR